jgi:ribosomal protein S18 acetylase RimI-like enzyme
MIGDNKILDVMRGRRQTDPMAARSVEIRAVTDSDSEELESVRGLMREYGAYLAANPAGAASICLVGYEGELAGVPGAYVAPGGLWVAKVDGQAAGCVALKKLPSEAGALELKRLWVGAEFRGLGLGRRLMQAAIDHAQSAGGEAIYLDTVPAAMPEANRLYAAMGFRQVERYNDNEVTDIVFFRLQLNSKGGLRGAEADAQRA